MNTGICCYMCFTPVRGLSQFSPPPMPKRRHGGHLSTEQHVRIRAEYKYLRGRGAIRKLARRFHVSHDTVERHVAAPSGHLTDTSAARSHPKLSKEDQKLFAEYMSTYGPVSKENLPGLLAEMYPNVSVSASTCVRYLKGAGLKHYATQTGPPIQERDKPARAAFAQDMLNKLPQTLFTDESTIGHLHSRAHGYWGERPGEHYHLSFPSGLRSNTVGSITSASTLPLQFPSETLTGARFGKVLDNILDNAPGNIKYLVMDNARIHGVPDVLDVLENHDVTWTKIPPYSPDLNPMEHCWANLKQQIDKENYQEQFTSVAALDGEAKRLWSKLDLTGTMESYKRTLHSVVDSNGEYTGA